MTRSEADYLLEAFDWLMPSVGLNLDEALSSFAGVRAIIDDGGGRPSSASRESARWSAPGFIGITGGKLTTFRVSARQVLKEAAKQLPHLRLAAEDAPLFDQPRQESPSLAPTAQQIVARASEQVRHLDDLLLRRSRSGLVLPSFGEGMIEPALAACRSTLGWDDARCTSEAARYRAHMRQQHALPAKH